MRLQSVEIILEALEAAAVRYLIAGGLAGARREQLRRWSELSLRQILEAQEEMQELALRFAAGRASGGD